MSAGRMAAERQRRRHRGEENVAVGAADAGGRCNATLATVTVHIPLGFRRRRGRKVLVAPDVGRQEHLGSRRTPAHARDELTATVRALARAFRWRRLLETGAVATVHEIAAAENINPSYVSRVMRLTLLAPDILEAVAGMEVSGAAALDALMMPFPIDWCRQALPDD